MTLADGGRLYPPPEIVLVIEAWSSVVNGISDSVWINHEDTPRLMRRMAVLASVHLHAKSVT